MIMKSRWGLWSRILDIAFIHTFILRHVLRQVIDWTGTTWFKCSSSWVICVTCQWCKFKFITIIRQNCSFFFAVQRIWVCFTQKEERRGPEDTITHARETFWCFRFDPTFNKMELELNYLFVFFYIQAARQPQNLTRGDFKSLQIQTFLGVIKSPKFTLKFTYYI